MNTEIMKVTPMLASTLLAGNSSNRRLSPATVDMYAREMKNGRWQKTHQGIAIYEDGVLADGQHRLAAVVKSGCSVEMLVTTGIPRQSASGIDVNRPRSAIDVVKITGSSDWLNSKMLQTTKLVYKSPKKLTPSELSLLSEEVKDSLIYVASLLKRNKKGTGAPLRAAMTLAHFYGADEDRLAEFVKMYYSGFVNDERDTAVIKLRDYMLASNGHTGGGSKQKNSFNLCQNAVRKFLDYTPVGVLRETKELQFPQLDPAPILESHYKD